MNLEHYDIIREKFARQVGLMLGNGEMGGPARNDGLGFDKLWLADYWQDNARRQELPGLRLESRSYRGKRMACAEYRQHLSLRKAVLETQVRDALGGYRSRMFLSAARPHVGCIEVEDFSPRGGDWILRAPAGAVAQRFSRDRRQWTLTYETKAPWMGLPFTRAELTLRANLPLRAIGAAAGIRLPRGKKLVVLFTVKTSFDDDRVNKEFRSLQPSRLLAEHRLAWKRSWGRFDIELPEGPYATTFYRSVYYTLSITGRSRFLQGECHFSEPCWAMHPFTVGAPAWAALAMSALNHGERAMRILDAFHKPDAMKQNAATYVRLLQGHGYKYEGPAADVEPMSFAHEIGIDGRELAWDFGRQRYLDGIGPALFHRVCREQDSPLTAQCPEYQVLRGCAAFFLRLANWDDSLKAYTLAPALGLDEVLVKPSMLCTVAACYWTLHAFAERAKQLGQDLPTARECLRVAKLLYWPRNRRHFVEYLGDNEDRRFDEYNCARVFSLLGYPFSELLDVLDLPKLRRTLDDVQQRNRIGQGVFNTMTANMFALTEAFLGRGDKAYEFSGYCLRRMDSSGVAMCEAHNDWSLYFGTGYCSFVLAVASMLVQWRGDVIRPFPAVPAEWKNVSFRNLRATGGILVSGEMRDGKVRFVRFHKNGRLLLELDHAAPVRVVRTGGKLLLSQRGQP